MIELLLAAENALALGLLDRAERTYRTVLEADPRNGIAAVGLSRVALERGDDAGARALALAALEIDPENATARRLVDRLDEVTRYSEIGGPDPESLATSGPEQAHVRRVPEPEPPPAASAPAVGPAPPPEMEPPPAAANQAAPARPGLLRRILRRS